MKLSNLPQAIATAHAANMPAFIWGPTGVGKSQAVAQYAATVGDFADVRACMLDPVDSRGLPVPNLEARLTDWLPASFWPRDGSGVLFLDELPQAPASVQNSLSQLILDRRLGDYELPAGWHIVAAGNRAKDRAATNRMPEHIKNRFLHLDAEPDLDSWCQWAFGAGVATEVIAFLRFRPVLLHSHDPKSNDNAFPTPRSWDAVNRLVTAGLPQEIEFDLIAGTVGEAAAAEFLGFLRIFRSLPNPDAVLLNPSAADVPDDPATLYALCGALANKAGANTADRLVEYAQRLPKEFSVLLVRDCARCAEFVTSRAFVEWSATNADVLI